MLKYVYLFERRFACVFITFKTTGEIFGHDDAGGGIFSWLFQTTTILLRDGVSWNNVKLLVSSLPTKYFTTEFVRIFYEIESFFVTYWYTANNIKQRVDPIVGQNNCSKSITLWGSIPEREKNGVWVACSIAVKK